jgi:hypothetical protein
VLKNAKVGDNFSDYELEELGGHLGFLGSYYKLEISTKEGNCHIYFVKSLPHNHVLKSAIEEVGLFKKEVLAYTEIFAYFEKVNGKLKIISDVKDKILICF